MVGPLCVDDRSDSAKGPGKGTGMIDAVGLLERLIGSESVVTD